MLLLAAMSEKKGHFPAVIYVSLKRRSKMQSLEIWIHSVQIGCIVKGAARLRKVHFLAIFWGFCFSEEFSRNSIAGPSKLNKVAAFYKICLVNPFVFIMPLACTLLKGIARNACDTVSLRKHLGQTSH